MSIGIQAQVRVNDANGRNFVTSDLLRSRDDALARTLYESHLNLESHLSLIFDHVQDIIR